MPSPFLLLPITIHPRTMSRWILPLFIVLAACAGRRPPGHVSPSSAGVVRSDSKAEACRLAEMLSAVAPGVVQALHVPPPAPVEVWQLTCEIPGVCEGRTEGQRIEIGKEARGQECWLMTHEYAHWCIDHDPLKRWAGLPQIALEGLAEFAAAWALPDLADEAAAGQREALERVERMDSLEKIFALGPKEWGAVADEELLRVFYALGFVLAARLGPDGLADLCAEARSSNQSTVSSASILSRAGLAHASPTGWIEALDESWKVLRSH